MKTKYFAATFLALGLSLASCSEPTKDASSQASPESREQSTTAVPLENTTTGTLTDISEGVTGEVGKMHGLYCDGVNDCRVQFVLEELTQLAQCDDYLMNAQPEGTSLIKASVRIIAKPAQDGSYDPGNFPVWADWSALTNDGLNQPLLSSDSCYNDRTQQWRKVMQADDTELRTHYMDVPEGTKAIRLTETLSNARWEYDLDTELDKVAEPTEQEAAALPDHSAPQKHAAIRETPTQPIEQPVVPVEHAPAEAPVRGFTGAPGSPIVEIDKTISHCGDPIMCETGTTFFTDGTTAWTEACSAQMLG